jgi:hypothetical protein
MNDLWDLLQQLDIWGLQAQLNRAEHSRSRREHVQDRKILALEEEIEEMRLKLAVLINLFVAKKVCTMEEITTVLTGLEAARKSTQCPRCDFTYQWDGARCGHCGYPEESPSFGAPPLERVWKVKIPAGQQEKASRRAVYELLEKHSISYSQRSGAADAFYHALDGEVVMRDRETAKATLAGLNALGITAEVIEPEGPEGGTAEGS